MDTRKNSAVCTVLRSLHDVYFTEKTYMLGWVTVWGCAAKERRQREMHRRAGGTKETVWELGAGGSPTAVAAAQLPHTGVGWTSSRSQANLTSHQQMRPQSCPNGSRWTKPWKKCRWKATAQPRYSTMEYVITAIHCPYHAYRGHNIRYSALHALSSERVSVPWTVGR